MPSLLIGGPLWYVTHIEKETWQAEAQLLVKFSITGVRLTFT